MNPAVRAELQRSVASMSLIRFVSNDTQPNSAPDFRPATRGYSDSRSSSSVRSRVNATRSSPGPS